MLDGGALLPAEDLILRSDVEMVRLQADSCDGNLWWLSHSLTGEVIALQASEVCIGVQTPISYVTGGYPADEPRWCSDLFEANLYQTAASGDVIVRAAGDEETLLFVDRYRNYIEMRMLVGPIGPSGHIRVEVEIMPLPRFGCRVFYALGSIYKALGLEKQDHSSQWVHKRVGA